MQQRRQQHLSVRTKNFRYGNRYLLIMHASSHLDCISHKKKSTSQGPAIISTDFFISKYIKTPTFIGVFAIESFEKL